MKIAEYKNPWHSARSQDPAIYRTTATPVPVGKYTRYYRIQSSNPSARCYDYVLDGVCVTQRCGQVDEKFLDEYLANKSAA